MARATPRIALIVSVFAAGCASEPAPVRAPVSNVAPAGEQRSASTLASRDQCARIFHHLLELELATAMAAATTDAKRAELEHQLDELERQRAPDFIVTCTQKTRAALIDCVLAASDIDAVTRCDPPAPSRR